MRKLWLVVLSIILVLGAIPEAEAQMNRKSIKKNNKRISSYKGRKSAFGKEKRYNSIGLTLNAVNYYGDLAPKPQRVSTDISFTRPGLGLTFVHRFGPRYSLKGEFLYATLKGSDVDSADPGDLNNGIFRYRRNLSFRNRIKELSVVGVFDLYDNQSTYISRVKWTPYAFVGISAFLHNPQAQVPATDLFGNALAEAGQWVDLRPLGTEGQHSQLQPTDVNFGIKEYKSLALAIPFGFGARFRLNEVMDLWADIGFRYTFTDYLDDVSQNYVDLDRLSSPLAQAMSYRTNELLGNPLPGSGVMSGSSGVEVYNGYGHEFRDNLRGSKSDRDIYMVTSVKLTYIIGATFHKAKFR